MAGNETKKRSVHPSASERGERETFTPLVDVYQKEDGTIVLEAEVPGATSESVDVRVDKGVLTIEADGGPPPVGESYSETYRGFGGGTYFRTFALSDEADRQRIDASCRDGVLTVTLPRAAAAETRKIQIKGE